MLTKRAKAYSSSSSQTVSLSPAFSSKFILKFCAAAENREKLIINSMSVPFCSRFHATPDNCSEITTFRRGSRLWRPPAPGSMNLGDRNLDCWNLRLMLKISYAGCLGLTPAISLQFSIEMCAASKYCEKFIKIPEGRFKVIQNHWCW